MEALATIDTWGVGHAASALVRYDADLEGRGDLGRRFRLASVTKLLSAYAAFVAIEERSVALDDPAGPPGSTVAHLLAHTSGLNLVDRVHPIARPGTSRIYSNAGFEVLAAHIEAATGFAFATYLKEAVLDPLEMHATALEGSAGSGAISSVADLSRFASELLGPTLIATETFTRATEVAFAGLSGVVPGFGRQTHCDWGLGFELRDHKSPHWTGTTNSPQTFGHFGQSGTFLWVDPEVACSLITLTDEAFGPWAAAAWPPFSDAVLAEVAASRPRGGPGM